MAKIRLAGSLSLQQTSLKTDMKLLTTTYKSFVLPVVLAVGLLAFSIPVNAQDHEKKSDRTIVLTEDGETVTIKMKDGVTTVNGVEVPEGESISDYLPEGFSAYIGDGDGNIFSLRDGNRFMIREKLPRGSSVWFSDEGVKAPNTFSFRGDYPLIEDFKRFNEMKFDGPEGAYLTHVRDLAGGYFSAMTPEISKKEREARELSRQIRTAEGSEKRELESKLDALLVEIFDAKLELRQERLEKSRAEVEKMEAELSERQRNKNEIIQRRKAELTGKGDYLEW